MTTKLDEFIVHYGSKTIDIIISRMRAEMSEGSRSFATEVTDDLCAAIYEYAELNRERLDEVRKTIR